jgi:hypothetical protein
MKTGTSHSILRVALLVGVGALMAGCGEQVTSVSSSSASAESSSATSSAFSFTPHSTSSSSSEETSSSSSSVSLDIEVMATISADGEYLVEGEDCDTSGCTLQAGCSTFYETPGDNYPTSGGECIACIVAPSILAYQISVEAVCDITFYTVCAKYENPWSLDSNVAYYLDDDTPFVTDYSDFGHTTENQWYNWKTVTLGTLTGVSVGIHQFNIEVLGAFPNTDCFKMEVANYGTVAA